jgi:hypothetical protein
VSDIPNTFFLSSEQEKWGEVMDYFDDFLDYEHEKVLAKRVSKKINENDSIVGIMRGLATAINSKLKSTNPEINTMIFLNGKPSKSIELLEFDKGEYSSRSYNLLPNGQIVLVDIDSGVNSIARYYIDLSKFKRMLLAPSEIKMNCYKQLKGLCKGMFIKASEVGVSPDKISVWQKKLSKLKS